MYASRSRGMDTRREKAETASSSSARCPGLQKVTVLPVWVQLDE